MKTSNSKLQTSMRLQMFCAQRKWLRAEVKRTLILLGFEKTKHAAWQRLLELSNRTDQLEQEFSTSQRRVGPSQAGGLRH